MCYFCPWRGSAHVKANRIFWELCSRKDNSWEYFSLTDAVCLPRGGKHLGSLRVGGGWAALPVAPALTFSFASAGSLEACD